MMPKVLYKFHLDYGILPIQNGIFPKWDIIIKIGFSSNGTAFVEDMVCLMRLLYQLRLFQSLKDFQLISIKLLISKHVDLSNKFDVGISLA